MTYLFTCPHCQTQTLVEEQFSGQAGECVMCGQKIQLPHFASNSSQQGVSTGDSQTQTRSARSTNQLIRWVAAATISLVALAAIVMLIVRYGGQSMQTMQANRMRGMCIQNLETIANAMRAYAKDYGSFPPPARLAPDGTPLHSWRVLLLPYLNQRELFEKFRLDEPWSSQHNQALVFDMPDVYRSPGAILVTGVESHYSMIVGQGTLFPANGPLGPTDVVDGWDRTLLLVEVATPTSLSNQWTDPGELDISRISNAVASQIGGNHEGGAVVVTVDGRGHFLRDSIEPSVLQALVTPSGNEGINDDVLD